jgi:hypothetical protein
MVVYESDIIVGGADMKLQKARTILASAATLCLVLIVSLLSACCLPTPPVSDVSSVNGQIVAPGCTIVSEGQEYQGNAPASSLVAIRKDGEIFLYHPAIGNADLSEETSRRAIGCFLTEYMTDAAAAGKVVLLGSGETAMLRTGMTVSSLEESVYRFVNAKRRWAAVSAPLEPRGYFVPPFKGILSKFSSIGDILETAFGPMFPAGQWDGSSSGIFDDGCYIKVDTDVIKTYGSVVRLLPITPLQTPITVLALSSTDFIQSIKEAYNADPELFVWVNTIDFIDFLGGAIKRVAGYIGLDYLEDIVAKQLIIQLTTALQVLFGDLSAGSGATEVLDHFRNTAAKSIVNSLTSVVMMATGDVGLVIRIVMDLAWIIDNSVIAQLEVASTLPYDEVASTTQPTQSITGAWAGNIVFFDSSGTEEGTYTLLVNVTQLGNNVTATWSTTLPSSGSLSAVISGTAINNLVLVTTSPVVQNFSGSGTISNNWNTVSGSVVPEYGGGFCSFVVNRS